jgi:hypothetical protein
MEFPQMPAFLGLGPDNPVSWCNFYRKGGFKTLLGTSAGYVAILGGLIFLSARLSTRDASRAYGAWSNGLLALQFLFTVIIGAGRVSATIRGDLSSGMLESLRMMPLAARHAIVGYLGSSAATLAGFFISNFLLGLIVNALAELPPAHWVVANGILFIFALFVWTVSAFLAFLVKSAGAILVIVSIVGVFGNAGLLYLAPGLVVLVGPLIGGTIFDTRTAQTEFAAPLAVSIAAQFLVGLLFFTGAARKYRRPDALALGGWLGLALLLAVVAISLLAILAPESFQPRFFRSEFNFRNPEVPFCGSTVLAMLIALVPLANFARLYVGWSKGRLDDPDLRCTTPSLPGAALIVIGLLSLMLLAFPVATRVPELRQFACFVAALFGFSLSVIFVAAWVYRAVDNAKVILGIWLILYCLIPLGVDFTRTRLSDNDEPALTMTAAFSPIGLLIESVSQPEADLRIPAIFNALIPLLPIGLYIRTARRQAIGRPAAGTPV